MYGPRRTWLLAAVIGSLGCSPEAQQSDAALTQDARWNVNDVSYLFPLPKEEGQEALLLSLDKAGAHGPLLPPELYDEHVGARFGGMWEGFFREEGYHWSRVIALRVDPCASETVVTSTTECRAEVRLSSQPLWGGDGEPMTSTVDAAIHLIYDLEQDELAAMLDELLALRADSEDTEDAPLGPHPTMLREGLAGPFAKGLNEIILKYVGGDNLAKFTVMVRGRNSTNWRFVQLPRGDDGKYALAAIPAAAEATTQGVNELGLEGVNNSRDTLVSPVDPAIGYPEALNKSELAMQLSRTKMKSALGRLASFEDPTKHSNLTLDCGSCHLSANARGFFEQLRGIPTPASRLFRPPADQNVTREDQTKLSGKALRAFGYFSSDVAISQRTINESARVADWLSHGGP